MARSLCTSFLAHSPERGQILRGARQGMLSPYAPEGAAHVWSDGAILGMQESQDTLWTVRLLLYVLEEDTSNRSKKFNVNTRARSVVVVLSHSAINHALDWEGRVCAHPSLAPASGSWPHSWGACQSRIHRCT